MSHFSRNDRGNNPWIQGVKMNTRIRTRQCWGCGADVAYSSNLPRKFTRAFCDDCKENLTADQKKAIVLKKRERNSYYNMVNDKKNRKDEERFIFNSPFRKDKNNG